MKRKQPTDRGYYFAAGCLIFFVVMVSYIAFGHPEILSHYKANAIVKSSNQIRTGQPVRIAGVDVGKISGIDPGPGHTTKIEMTFKKSGEPLHTDAALKIRPRLFLEGGYYVDLDAGSPSAPELKSGGTIPFSQTAVPVQLNDVLSSLDSPNRKSFTAIVRETSIAVSGGGATSFKRFAPNLAPIFRDLAWVAKASRGTAPHDVSELVANAAKVVKQTGDRDAELGGLVVSLDRTAQALNAGDRALGDTVEAFDRVLRVSPPALSGVAASLPTLRTFSRALRPSLPAAPGQLRAIRTALKQLGGLVEPRERKRVVGALSTTFEDLPTLVQRLGNLLPVARPFLQCAQQRIIPTLLAKVPDGNMSNGQPAYMEFAHALVGFSGVSQGFDGNGPVTRYDAGISSGAVSLQSIPGIGQVLSTGVSTLQARPKWLGSGVDPKFAPDAKCTDQPLPSLESETVSIARTPVRTKRAKITRKQLRSFTHSRVRKILEKLK
jgi:phospholipid/cholesterol/gamma-HCH transport system substrate-binding protein